MLVFVLGFYSLLGFRNFRFVLYSISMVKVIGNCIVFLIFSLVFFVMFRILGKIVVDGSFDKGLFYIYFIYLRRKRVIIFFYVYFMFSLCIN